MLIERSTTVADLDFKAIGLKIKERRQALGITQERIANILECSVDYFISGEYTYKIDKNREKTLDDKIMDKLKYCDTDKKTKFLLRWKKSEKTRKTSAS